jgi:peptidoglycan hydrolase CwlO-like protein
MEVNQEMWQTTVQSELTQMRTDIRTLQDKSLIHDGAIDQLKSDIGEIKGDTKWLRRAFTNAFIVAFISGMIGIVYTAFQLLGGS